MNNHASVQYIHTDGTRCTLERNIERIANSMEIIADQLQSRNVLLKDHANDTKNIATAISSIRTELHGNLKRG